MTDNLVLSKALPLHQYAIFLDIDGTLLGLQTDPGAVISDAPLRDLLGRLNERCSGRLALISGRSVAEIDRIFSPLRLRCAGSHGSERRFAPENDHEVCRSDSDVWTSIASELARFVEANEGLLLERKPTGFALHYRPRPELENDCRQIIETVAQRVDTSHEVLHGKKVAELVPAGFNKGTAIAEFLALPEYSNATPIFIGDDTTDEAGFDVVNRHNGISVRVGDSDASHATYSLADVDAVHRWLQQLLTADTAEDLGIEET